MSKTSILIRIARLAADIKAVASGESCSRMECAG